MTGEARADDAVVDGRGPRDRSRVGAYAICRRGDEVLLTRASSRTAVPGKWFLPGGGLDYGERPEDAVLRELREETGLEGAAPRLVGVWSDLHDRPNDERIFTVRILYEVEVRGGTLAHEADGTSDEARWVQLDEVAALGATPYVLYALGLDDAK